MDLVLALILDKEIEIEEILTGCLCKTGVNVQLLVEEVQKLDN